jgi:glyoxylase-like metal-dependent hydrolase (beta-lactamase superfamily II)
MHQVADDVWQLGGVPRNMFNVYLAGDVLIDAATRWGRPRVLRQLQGRKVRLVALTHCHPDHQGAARAVCKRFGVPLACHQADVPAMTGTVRMQPHNWVMRLGEWVWSGPAHAVERVLGDGDEVGGFRVVHAPGHTPGHVMYFREADGLAIAGDVLANISFLTRKPGLREPPAAFSVDMAENRRSIRKLLELRHGLLWPWAAPARPRAARPLGRPAWLVTGAAT